jgi:hypothetical protein
MTTMSATKLAVTDLQAARDEQAATAKSLRAALRRGLDRMGCHGGAGCRPSGQPQHSRRAVDAKDRCIWSRPPNSKNFAPDSNPLGPFTKNPKASTKRFVVLNAKHTARASSICSRETPASIAPRMSAVSTECSRVSFCSMRSLLQPLARSGPVALEAIRVARVQFGRAESELPGAMEAGDFDEPISALIDRSSVAATRCSPRTVIASAAVMVRTLRRCASPPWAWRPPAQRRERSWRPCASRFAPLAMRPNISGLVLQPRPTFVKSSTGCLTSCPLWSSW